MPLDMFDNTNFECTNYDILKIESLDIGEKMEAESGDFMVFKYKDHFVVFLRHDQRIQDIRKEMLEFKTEKELIKFLQSK